MATLSTQDDLQKALNNALLNLNTLDSGEQSILFEIIGVKFDHLGVFDLVILNEQSLGA